MVTTGLSIGEEQAIGRQGNPADFNNTVQIPEAQVHPDMYRTYLSVDLVEPGQSPSLMPGIKILQQAIYRDAIPWIMVTFYYE